MHNSPNRGVNYHIKKNKDNYPVIPIYAENYTASKIRFEPVSKAWEIYGFQKANLYLPIYMRSLQNMIWGYSDLPVYIRGLQYPMHTAQYKYAA